MQKDFRDPQRILSSHPNLVETVSGGGIRLTIPGRLFVLTLLLNENILTQRHFGQIVESFADGTKVFIETCKLLHEVSGKWLKAHAEDLEQRGNKICQGTDLSYQSIGVLMWVMEQSQKNFIDSLGRENVLERRRVPE